MPRHPWPDRENIQHEHKVGVAIFTAIVYCVCTMLVMSMTALLLGLSIKLWQSIL